MSADLTARLAALLEKEYGCKPGQVHEGYGAECASSAHAPALYRTFGCDHVAHVAAVLAEAGVGFVADFGPALYEKTMDAVLARAERAEAALADLRARAKPLARECQSLVSKYTRAPGANGDRVADLLSEDTYRIGTAILALLDTEADQ